MKYRDFTLPLLPNIDEKTFIGVRLPIITKYANDLDEKSRVEFMNSLPHQYHEENILHAFILSNIKDYDTFIHFVDLFLLYVSNWSTCDTICNKNLTKYRDRLIKDIYSRTTFNAYKNMPLFLNFGFASGAFHKNTIFFAK